MKCSRKFQKSFKDVSKVFQERVVKGRLKGVLRELNGVCEIFMGV